MGRLDPKGIGAAPEKAGEVLALMRDALPLLARQSTDREVLNHLYQQICLVAEEMENAGIPSLQQFANAIRIVFQDFIQTPSRVNSASLQNIERSLDLMRLLLTEETPAKLKTHSPLRIFAVDDEGETLHVIASQLRSIGLNLHSISNPSKAIEVITQGRNYDLIILAMEMPVLNGLELCVRIRKLKGFRSTPVLFLAEGASPELETQSRMVGGNDLARKPVIPAEIGLSAVYWALKGRLGLSK